MQSRTPIDALSDDEMAAFLDEIVHDDGAAAREHLANGNPIYVFMPDTPAGAIEKRFPDGSRQFVRFDLKGEHAASDIMQPDA
ncbi:hypothetical protein ACKI2N_032140 [Cupriavidus sp. 30B13]|uniref:hypothetical protein n=1 Tax=Cupriavidus sp. 30B13 TaxID=3384241 RepID=UPI003CF847CD